MRLKDSTTILGLVNRSVCVTVIGKCFIANQQPLKIISNPVQTHLLIKRVYNSYIVAFASVDHARVPPTCKRDVIHDNIWKIVSS